MNPFYSSSVILIFPPMLYITLMETPLNVLFFFIYFFFFLREEWNAFLFVQACIIIFAYDFPLIITFL
jgi:hypothetical protein